MYLKLNNRSEIVVKEFENIAKEGFLFEDEQIKKTICLFGSIGYPKESFVVNLPIGKNFNFDLTIINPTSGDFLYIFEYKTFDSSKDRLGTNFKRWIKRMKDKNISLLVNEVFFIIKDRANSQVLTYLVDLKQELFKEVELEKEIKPFFSETIKIKSEKIANTKIEKKNSITLFTIICIVLGVTVSCILLLDILYIIDMTTNRLILLGAIILIFLSPFASKVKIANIEFERLLNEDNKEKLLK